MSHCKMGKKNVVLLKFPEILLGFSQEYFPSINLANIEFITFIDILGELYCAVEL